MQTEKFWFLRERLVFGIVAILSITGIFTWFTINEQEDPSFPYRNGFINIIAPGMSADALESMIIRPLERSLNAIDEVSSLTSEVSDGAGSVDVKLNETAYDNESTWQRIRDKVNDAKALHSNITTEFELQDRAQDTAGILLAIKSEKPILEVRQFALYLRNEIYKLSDIREINLVGDTGARLEVFFPQELMLETGISPLDVANKIEERNTNVQMGTLKSDVFESNIVPITRLEEANDLAQVDIETKDGESLKLGVLADIQMLEDPNHRNSFWVNGEKRIGLSIVLPPNKTRVVDVGDNLLALIKEINSNQSEYEVEPIFFQPNWTKERRDGLAKSLVISCVGVGLVLFLLMTRKLAFVVSITIPAIALSSLAFFGFIGGTLQQMSIAGMVISLGLMVDNSIVMSELIARYRDKGLSSIQASHRAIKELYKPLATSTLTTIAAFVPMLLSKGDVADFIRMVPVIVITAILVSYLYAITLLPAIALNMKEFRSGNVSSFLGSIGAKMGALGTARPKITIISFFLLLILSFFIGSDEDGEFFPKSARNQAFIDIQGDYGLSHNATLNTVRVVENILADVADVTKVVSFVGDSGPRFYYNMTEAPNQTNVARIVFTTETSEQIPAVVERLNDIFEQTFFSTRVHAKEIGQGPPIDAPIEIRILGDDRDTLLAAAEDVFALLNSHPGTVNTRRDYVVGKPKLAFTIDDNTLHKSGLTRSELSQFIAWRASGLNVGTIPEERESVPIVLIENRLHRDVNANYLMNTLVADGSGALVPISMFTSYDFQSEQVVLTRHRGFNSQSISSDVSPNANEDSILMSLLPSLNAIESRYNVSFEFGGEAEEEEESGSALVTALPVGIILLFTALMVQFNSFRISALIMITIPLAMVGVNPMLTLVGVNFGFMSVLGLLALTGIVVNTAIILIDKVLMKLKEDNMSLKQAINQATSERFRPVILTAVTTIVGMLPLTSPDSPLWPPLAWTIIGGLITSTLLSLVVLPAFLMVLLKNTKNERA